MSLSNPIADVSQNLLYFPQRVIGTDQSGNAVASQDLTLITATGVTTTQTSSDQINYTGRGLIVVLDMTTVGTGSVTLEIDGKDAASGKYYALLTGAAVTTNSTNVYTVYPGATAVNNTTTCFPLPHTWRVKVTANNANATTYTVGASVIL